MEVRRCRDHVRQRAATIQTRNCPRRDKNGSDEELASHRVDVFARRECDLKGSAESGGTQPRKRNLGCAPEEGAESRAAPTFFPNPALPESDRLCRRE